ncbi:MAG: amidohydrolase family protein [Fibrobacter sp.]|nr:amidohydrolase family protein [Fibrobacter sp.]
METVFFAKWILLENGEILTNGAISVVGNKINSIGLRSKVRRSSSVRVINLGDCLVLPGLINLHTHLEESVIRGIQKDPDETFATWSIKKDARVKLISQQTLHTSIKLTARELLAEGITTVVDCSKTPLSGTILSDESIRSKIIHEISLDDFLQEKNSFDSYLQRIAICSSTIGLSPSTLQSLPLEAHKQLRDFVLDKNLLWATHLAESAEELQAFSEHSGDLFFHTTRRQPWPFEKTPFGPVDFALNNNLIPDGGICFHCNYINGSELDRLAAKKASIVHCHTYTEELGHKMFPLDAARNRNLSICIGTEGIAAPGKMSLFDELFSLKCAYPHIPALEMLRWVTINPAVALKMENQLGSLTPGKYADIIAVRFAHNPQEDLLEELLVEEPEIVLVMVDGEEVIVGY